MVVYALSAAICTSALVLASYQDWTKREINDGFWIAICVCGSVLLFIGYGDVMRLIGSLILTALLFSERLSGWRAVPPAAVAVVCMILTHDITSLMILVMFFSIYGMYCSGILKGGADAKALISIAIAFPFYPDHVLISAVYPAGYAFCPCFSILFTALVLTMVWTALISVRNMMDGFGLSVSRGMTLDEAESSFVWPTEDVEEGRKVRIRPTDDPHIYERLRNAGFDEVRTTWKIPFIIPITVSYIVTMTAGSPLFLIL